MAYYPYAPIHVLSFDLPDLPFLTSQTSLQWPLRASPAHANVGSTDRSVQ